MRLCCALLVIVPAVLIGLLANDIRNNLRYDLQLKLHDGKCTLLETPTSCEDLTALGDGESVIAGGGDLWNTFFNGSASAIDGAFWLVNAKSGSLRRIEIEGDPLPRLLLHGIYYSQQSRRLYAVNHDEATGESVEIFDVIGTGDDLKLRHMLTIRSPLFGNFQLNDVVEGEGEEIYITEWRPFPFPAGGKAGEAHMPFSERALAKLEVPIALGKVPLTRVFRCNFRAALRRKSKYYKIADERHPDQLPSAEPVCEMASATRFVQANGIAVSADRRSVFVNDPVTKTIHVLERKRFVGQNKVGEPGFSLRKVSSFRTKHALDNIEMDQDGKLTGGSIPFPYTSASVCDEAEGLSATKVVDGREIGCGKSPGGLLRISLLGTGGHSFVDGTQSDHAMHDGSLMSGVSAALQIGNKVLLGSPNSPGVLLCDV